MKLGHPLLNTRRPPPPPLPCFFVTWHALIRSHSTTSDQVTCPPPLKHQNTKTTQTTKTRLCATSPLDCRDDFPRNHLHEFARVFFVVPQHAFRHLVLHPHTLLPRDAHLRPQLANEDVVPITLRVRLSSRLHLDSN